MTTNGSFTTTTPNILAEMDAVKKIVSVSTAVGDATTDVGEVSCPYACYWTQMAVGGVLLANSENGKSVCASVCHPINFQQVKAFNDGLRGVVGIPKK